MGVYERIVDGEDLTDDPEFVSSLLENTSEGMLVIDENSRIVHANPAMTDILGYQPDELIGSTKMKIIPERLRSVHAESLQQYLETGTRNIDWDGIELPALHREGHEVPVVVSLREYEYDGERIFTGLFRDITERREREKRLRRQKEDLEEFAGVLSHDLRNPLSVAQGYADIAHDAHPSEELVKVTTALDRMDQIIHDMLSRTRYASDDTEATTEIDFRAATCEAWDSIFAPDATFEPPEAGWMVTAHEGRLKQLAENLFRNSVEHGSTGNRRAEPAGDSVKHGSTESRTASGDGEGSTIPRADGEAGDSETGIEVRVGVIGDGDGFYIEDTGRGLPDYLQGRTWLPEQSDDGDGPGYGLRIAERIASEHGWTMWLTASADGGARFEFTDVQFSSG